MEIDVARRYAEKLRTYCGGLDPYKLVVDRSFLPVGVELFDIQNYLLDHHSNYSRETFKAYKSMDAYKWFVGGWVQSIGSYLSASTDGTIVVAKVVYF